MKPIHKRRIAKLALALLDAWDADKKRLVRGKRELEFNMDLHMTDDSGIGVLPEDHRCGTTCCFLGFAPLVIPATRKMSWAMASHHVTGEGEMSDTWSFLFSPVWPNNPVQAAKRSLWILNEGKPKENAKIIYPRMKPVHLRESLQGHANA